jgi:hypothetical protein
MVAAGCAFTASALTTFTAVAFGQARYPSRPVRLVVPAPPGGLTDSVGRLLAGFIALARSRPGQFNYVSAGIGSANHVLTERFKALAGIDMAHIPFRGGAPLMTALMAGEVQFALLDFGTAEAALRSGKARALAQSGERRHQGPCPGAGLDLGRWQLTGARRNGGTRCHRVPRHSVRLEARSAVRSGSYFNPTKREKTMSFPPIHRVVTGHDADGKAIVTSNGPLPNVAEIKAIPGTVFHEVWCTTGAPASVDNGADPTFGPLSLPPPKLGTRIRYVDIPPDTADYLANGGARMQEAFAQIGDSKASTVKVDSPHPLMHRTESVDYGIVIEGEMTLVLDDSEVLLKVGSVVVQRGSNHAWANRSGRLCRMLFVLVDGAFAPAIADALAGR